MTTMASGCSIVKVPQDDVPDDGKPLLEDAGNSRSNGPGPPYSAIAAHRRRVGAFLQVLWDSGVLCICNASVFFSLAALFVKLLGGGVPVFEIVFFRSFSSFLVCAAYAHFARVTPLFGHRDKLPFLLSRGLFGAAAMTTYYFSLKLLPLADAVTLFFLNPAITAVAAWAIMKEPLGLKGVAGVLVSLCGLVLLTRPPFLFGPLNSATSTTAAAGNATTSATSAVLHGDGGVGVSTADVDATGSGGWDSDRLLGSMFGLLSAVLSAGAFISIRYIGKSEPALVVSVYFHVCAASSSVVPLVAGLPAHAVWPSAVQWALLLGIACCSFWGQIFIGRSFQLLNAARASAINLTQVVYSYMLGLLFLNETLTLLGAAGSVLIGAGAMLVNWKKKPAPQPTPPAPCTDGPSSAEAADGHDAAGKSSADASGGGADAEAACTETPAVAAAIDAAGADVVDNGGPVAQGGSVALVEAAGRRGRPAGDTVTNAGLASGLPSPALEREPLLCGTSTSEECSADGAAGVGRRCPPTAALDTAAMVGLAAAPAPHLQEVVVGALDRGGQDPLSVRQLLPSPDSAQLELASRPHEGHGGEEEAAAGGCGRDRAYNEEGCFGGEDASSSERAGPGGYARAEHQYASGSLSCQRASHGPNVGCCSDKDGPLGKELQGEHTGVEALSGQGTVDCGLAKAG